ncbi:hypothetical protein BG005_001445 [Podila minutissima]|nr:hypothetical protein BG005_001445 [Podila minutissima]
MAMDNKTVRDAIAVHGTDPQFLIEKILRTRIYECSYWKEQCFGLTESSIIEKAYALTSIGGQYGNQKPTDFICLVLKLLQIQPRDEIVFKYITGLTESENNKQVPYVFMTFSGSEPVTIYQYLESLLDDGRKLRKRGMGGYSIIHMDEFIDELLREERVCDVVLPRLVKRYVLEDTGELDPRQKHESKLEPFQVAIEVTIQTSLKFKVKIQIAVTLAQQIKECVEGSRWLKAAQEPIEITCRKPIIASTGATRQSKP